MSEDILFAWIGKTDLRAAAGEENAGGGRIGRALADRHYDRVVLLNNLPEEQIEPFLCWLRDRTDATVAVHQKNLSSPMNFSEVYEAARDVVAATIHRAKTAPRCTFHLTPGTPAMQAVWIILAKTRFAAEIIQSSAKYGVQTVSIPFEIAADYIPDLLRGSDQRLERLSSAQAPEGAEFADIIHRSNPMRMAVSMAEQISPRSIPVLLEGESGTGKELFARAIHRASPRRGKPFVAVNCGAIPRDLVESELFGYEKGAFTGAIARRIGDFEAAQEGTVFLDEIGELPVYAQVKLLRVLQESEVRRLGSSKAIKLNIRVIAATNRNLLEEVAKDKFRGDLFYRLAVAIIRLPPLRDREGDISLLISHFMQSIHTQNSSDPGYKRRELSASAMKLLHHYAWPGNVRELANTLLRAVIWSKGTTIDASDIQQALLPAHKHAPESILDRPLGNVQLNDVLSEVARHYLTRALEASHGNKVEAAKLVGLSSYQTFTNWVARYGINDRKEDRFG
jgi:transcriptional regulator with GAF, ATPase, and Fis domain